LEICRIKTNKVLDELIKHQNIINYVKAERLSWFGHINRMPEISIIKKTHKLKPFKSRPAARPESQWEDDVKNDLNKMKLIKLTEQVQERLKWKLIFKKVKTIRVVAQKKKKKLPARRAKAEWLKLHSTRRGLFLLAHWT